MSDTQNQGCDCVHFFEGDWVQSRLNPDVFGIVVSDSDFGRFITVQLAVSLEFKQFYAVTLQHIPLKAGEPGEAEDLPDNVIRVDFTKPRELRETTKTVGEA